jgi:hypothetical protein
LLFFDNFDYFYQIIISHLLIKRLIIYFIFNHFHILMNSRRLSRTGIPCICIIIYLIYRFPIDVNTLSNYISNLFVTCTRSNCVFILILCIFDSLVSNMHFESLLFHFLNGPLIFFLLLSNISKHTFFNKSFHEFELVWVTLTEGSLLIYQTFELGCLQIVESVWCFGQMLFYLTMQRFKLVLKVSKEIGDFKVNWSNYMLSPTDFFSR